MRGFCRRDGFDQFLHLAMGSLQLLRMMTTSTQWMHLERDPKSSYRQLSIKGKRIKARTLFGLYANAQEPMTAEQIAEAHDLPLDAVREAIAYCQSNPPEIQQDFQVEEALAQAAGMNDANYRGKPK